MEYVSTETAFTLPQDKDGPEADEITRLIIRIWTFPHHRHTPELEESEEVSLEDIIKVIKGKLNR
jgi:hypothetical protein